MEGGQVVLLYVILYYYYGTSKEDFYKLERYMLLFIVFEMLIKGEFLQLLNN